MKSLAFSYDCQDRQLLERVLPLVDYVEVAPDALARVRGDHVELDPEAIAELVELGDDIGVIVHGTSLSVGSYDGWSETYVRLLDEFVEQVDVRWHSEHLGYTMVDGQFLGTMLALPRTDEALDLVCGRIGQIQSRYGLPFLVEHVVDLLPQQPADYSDAGFLNEVATRTGCALILDLYNLECDANNRGLDVAAFLAELDLDRVQEVHLAGGVLRDGVALDVHSRPVGQSTLALLAGPVLAATSARAVTYEVLREAVPALGHDGIVDVLDGIRGALALTG